MGQKLFQTELGEWTSINNLFHWYHNSAMILTHSHLSQCLAAEHRGPEVMTVPFCWKMYVRFPADSGGFIPHGGWNHPFLVAIFDGNAINLPKIKYIQIFRRWIPHSKNSYKKLWSSKCDICQEWGYSIARVTYQLISPFIVGFTWLIIMSSCSINQSWSTIFPSTRPVTN